MRVGEPCRASVVKARQCARFERGCGGLVARHRTCRIAGNRLVQPLDPFGRVEPPVAQLVQPLSCVRDDGGARVVCIVGDGSVRRQSVGERKRLEGGGRGVARSVFQAGAEPERPRLMEPAVQDAEDGKVSDGNGRGRDACAGLLSVRLIPVGHRPPVGTLSTVPGSVLM